MFAHLTFSMLRSPGTTSHRSGVQECLGPTSPLRYGPPSRLMDCSQNLPPVPGAGVLTYTMALAGAYSQPPGSIHSKAVCFPPRASRNASRALNPPQASVFVFFVFCGVFFFSPFYKIEVWLIYNVVPISAV